MENNNKAKLLDSTLVDPEQDSPVRLYRILNYAKLSIKTFKRPSECSICVLMKNPVQTYWAILLGIN